MGMMAVFHVSILSRPFSLCESTGTLAVAAIATLLAVPRASGADYREALSTVETRLGRLCAIAGSEYPDHTVNGKWKLREPSNWTAGYFAGMLWLMYGQTKDPVWLERAQRWTNPIGEFRHDKRDLNFGLSFMPTFVAGYRLTGDTAYRRIALDAARSLAAR